MLQRPYSCSSLELGLLGLKKEQCEDDWDMCLKYSVRIIGLAAECFLDLMRLGKSTDFWWAEGSRRIYLADRIGWLDMTATLKNQHELCVYS